MGEPVDTSNLLPEELEALQSRGPAAPQVTPEEQKPTTTAEVPPPSPEVVDRMRSRLAAAENAEEAFRPDASSAQEGDAAKAEEQTTEEQQPEVSDQDKERFLLSVLGGEPFSKSYELFAGRMTVVMRVRTAAEDDLAGRQAYLDDQLEGQQETEAMRRDAARLTRYRNYCMAISLSSIALKGQTPRRFAPVTGTNPPETDLHLRLKELRQELSQPVFMVIFRLWQQFEDVCGKLLLESQTPDFWNTGAAT